MLLACALAFAADATPDLAAVATGRFVAAQRPEDIERALATALDRSLEPIPWAFRGFARSALEEQATACPAYTMSFATDNFTVQCDGRDRYSWKVGQEGPFVTPKGETTQMSFARSGRAFVLRFDGERGGRSWTYTFPEAGGLEVRHEVTSRHLTVPMTWTLVYAKQ